MCVEIHTCTTRGAPFLFRKSGYFENVDIMKKGIVLKSGFFEKIVTKNARLACKLYSLTLLSISYSWYDNVRWSDRRLIISEQVFRHSDHQVQFRGDNESLEILKSVPISVSNQFHGAWANSKSMDQFHGFQYPSLKRRKWLWTSFPLPFLVDFGWHWAYLWALANSFNFPSDRPGSCRTVGFEE